tara:strand:- start:234 stop:419 length:186 start_codon:yes stop_codon:yes gene_type:complete
MKNLALLIEGTYTSNIQTLEWECPFTGNYKSAFGEFTFDGNYFTHDVYDENDVIVYTVISN